MRRWRLKGCCAAAAVLLAAAAVGGPVRVTRVGGAVGERLAACVTNGVAAAEADAWARVFRDKTETRWWQTEFWGKWMLGAAPLAAFTGDRAIEAKMASSADIILSAQRADGYLGNYRDDAHLAFWDVWGRKYVMHGLLARFGTTGDARFLEAAVRVCDHLMTEVGPGRTPLHSVGSCRGMAALSVLEAVMDLHARLAGRGDARAARILDFARYIAEEMDDAADGPALVRKALAGVDVADRWPPPHVWWSREQGAKAYEMMSCCLGLLAYARAAGDARLREVVVKTAENIRDTEINAAGSGTTFECWYHGRRRETQATYSPMETCVTVTWLRLAGALLEETGDPAWADEFEKTFYNAYLASLAPDGGTFSKYCPLAGPRGAGGFQCGLKVNCCSANGPRGFAELLRRLARTDADGAVCLDVYAPCAFTAEAGGVPVRFTVETDYPRGGRVTVRVDPARDVRFTLNLRRPAWETGGAAAYRAETRLWRKGDAVTLDFALALRPVERDGHLSFRRGPLTLARDARFGDGSIHAAAVPPKGCDGLEDLTGALAATPVETAWPTLFACTIPMRFGLDLSAKRTQTPRATGFCDFASAAGGWDAASDGRVWLEYPFNAQEPAAARTATVAVTNARTKAVLTIPAPDVHAAYGRHPRQTVDVWRPRGQGQESKRPVAVYIHGGAWTSGAPVDVVVGEQVEALLARGVAVASVGYRLLTDAPDARPPLAAVMDDVAAAVDYIRAHAEGWGVDAGRLGLAGGSAGGCAALALALADGNARGVRAVAALYPQTTLDPAEMAAWVPGIDYGAAAFGCRTFADFQARRGDLSAALARFSPAALARAIDPAAAPEMVLEYWPGAYPARPGAAVKDPVHSAQFGQRFADICRARGLRCTLLKGDCREAWRRLAETLLAP